MASYALLVDIGRFRPISTFFGVTPGDWRPIRVAIAGVKRCFMLAIVSFYQCKWVGHDVPFMAYSWSHGPSRFSDREKWLNGPPAF